jgi:iron complex transport system substrate-binding protein
MKCDQPDTTRRRLLQALALSPLLAAWPSLAAARPDLARIVALEWAPTELLLALGVPPLGVADTYNYRLWVKEPALPPEVVDVGSRIEPNLELLQQLRPSLLLLSAGYGPSPDALQRIAPSMGFAFYDGKQPPLLLARRALQQLAERLDLRPAADRHLAEFDALMAQTRAQLPAARRPVLLFSFLDARHVLVFGKGSLFMNVLDELGVPNAWPGDTNFWGSAVVGIEQLSAVKPAHALCFDHGDHRLRDEITATPLWQSLPLARDGVITDMPATWFYGTTLSAMRFCRLLPHALGGRP